MIWGAIIGAAVSIGGSYFSSKKQSDAIEASTRAQEVNYAHNIEVARREAEWIRQDARGRAYAVRLAGQRLQGEQRAKYAASGIRLRGSPLEVMADSAALIEVDALEAERQGRIERWRKLKEIDMLKEGGATAAQAASIRKDAVWANFGAGLASSVGNIISQRWGG